MTAFQQGRKRRNGRNIVSKAVLYKNPAALPTKKRSYKSPIVCYRHKVSSSYIFRLKGTERTHVPKMADFLQTLSLCVIESSSKAHRTSQTYLPSANLRFFDSDVGPYIYYALTCAVSNPSYVGSLVYQWFFCPSVTRYSAITGHKAA